VLGSAHASRAERARRLPSSRWRRTGAATLRGNPSVILLLVNTGSSSRSGTAREVRYGHRPLRHAGTCQIEQIIPPDQAPENCPRSARARQLQWCGASIVHVHRGTQRQGDRYGATSRPLNDRYGRWHHARCACVRVLPRQQYVKAWERPQRCLPLRARTNQQ